MEVETKEGLESLQAPAAGITADTKLDVETLRGRKEMLQEDLRASMLEGDALKVWKIRDQLKGFDDVIFAAEVGHSKATIDRLTDEITEVRNHNEQLMRIRAEQNKILAEKLDAAREVQADVGRTEVAIATCNIQLQSLRIGRNELRDKLKALAETTMGETNERF